MLKSIILLIVLFCSLTGVTATTDNSFYVDRYSQSVHGGIGLIQTPSARFSNDGEFGFGISSEEPFNRLYAKAQFFPWMEAVLKYTEGTHRPYHKGSSQTWKDKGIDLKFKLFEEGNNFPAIAIGFIDVGGTGAYASEYIVASKAYKDFDLSLGLGWGKLNGKEHLGNIFWWRDTTDVSTGLGGLIQLERFFSGSSMSLFGGVEYFTSIPNLSAKIEYDTTDYDEFIGRPIEFNKPFDDIFQVDSNFNYAINYRVNIGARDKLDLSLGFVRGNTVYLNIATHSNLNFSGPKKVILGAERLRNSNLETYSSLNDEWKKYLTDRIIWELGNVGFVTHKLIYNDNELAAEISQGRFPKTSEFFDLASRILANNAPKNIEQITVINIDQGIETLRSTIDKDILFKALEKGPLQEKSLNFNYIQPINENATIEKNEYLYPNFFWEIKPHATGTLQHQKQFYFWQLEALMHTEYSIKQGLYLTTDIGINIANNYDEYTYHVADGELYHVRQNRRLYLTEGETGLRKMALDYLVDFNPNLKAKFSAGILEWMYGGIGGEILYIPDDKRWGLSIDAYWVKQRDYDQKFSFKEYETITGHISYYRDIPIYDMRLKVSIGQFLAKDIGTHIDVSRRFKTGARIGGIVALTDCKSECVGEGSFNKWIYFELPMDLFYINSSTRAKTGYAWSPLTKDAGQKIEPSSLYNLVINATDEVDALRLKPWSIKKILSGFGTKPQKRI